MNNWNDQITQTDDFLDTIEDFSKILNVDLHYEGFCGYDFSKESIDKNIDNLEAYVAKLDNIESYKSLGSLIIHHGSILKEKTRIKIIQKVSQINILNHDQKMNLKRFTRDINNYQTNHPIPQEEI